MNVTDDDGATDSIEKSITVIGENDPPFGPRITGSTIVKAREEMNYLFQAEDPNNDDVKYVITWGDSTSDETDFYPSNEPVLVSHFWNTTLPIMILRMTVKAVDEHGAESILIEKWVIITSLKSVDTGQNYQRPIKLLVSRLLDRIFYRLSFLRNF